MGKPNTRNNDKFNKSRNKGNVRNRTLDKKDGQKGSSRGNSSNFRAGVCNDPEWYNLNPQSTKDVASIPYNRATGLNWNLTNQPQQILDPVTPGILGCAIALDPLSNSKSDDPINVCAREIVAQIRSFNSGAANYDPNDYMLRVLAQADILAWINFAIRAYSTWNMYSPYNRYMPEALLKVQGLDPAWFREHANDFRARLNHIITQAANILYVPEQIYLFRRYMWLFANYYSDSESAKDQLYVLFPTNYHKFEIDPNTSMGMLKEYIWYQRTTDNPGQFNVNVIPVLQTGDDLLDVIEDMLFPLIEDQDLCIINGDMIKAYGPSRLSFSLVSDIQIAVPVYQPDVLWQIRNSRSLPEFDGRTCFDIVQDANGTILERGGTYRYKDTFLYAWTDQNGVNASFTNGGMAWLQHDFYGSDGIIDTDRLDPDPLLTMENTRMLAIPTTRNQLNNDFYLACGPDVVEFYVIVNRAGNSRAGYTDKYFYFKSFVIAMINTLPNTWPTEGLADNDTMTAYTKALQIHAYLSAFEYAPAIWEETDLIVDNGGGPVAQQFAYSEPQMSQNNMAFVSAQKLDRMNYTAYLSLLGIKGPNAV